jgi:hypothetical protein
MAILLGKKAMVDPVTVGSLVAETLSMAAEAVLKSETGEAVKDGYKALREKVSHWASSDVVALEATPGSIDRQAAIAKIIDAQSEEDRTSLRVLAEALVAKLKECADSAATEDQSQALLKFRQILIQLASRPIDGLENNNQARLTRNPFVMLVRWYQRESGFEKTVAKYASLLPILETSGMSYSKTALIGIIALQARQLEIARTVYTDVRFLTTPSAALDPLTKGITSIVFLLVIVILIVAAVLYGIVFWKSIPVDTLNTYVSQEMIHSIVAFCFGCLGGIVSLLNRLSDFDSKQVRSRDYLFMYGLTLPIVGGVFALILAAVMDAKIISILDNRTQLFIVIGFLAGFSERFTQALLQYVQGRFLPKSGQQGQGLTQQTNQAPQAETGPLA